MIRPFFSWLKNHPFPVEAWFDSSLVLTFAIKKEQAADLLPECLEPDTFQDKWAFVAVAMVNAKHLRPQGFPKVLGSSFFLIGYRIFVRYINAKGKRLRGLYILKSETNKRKMEFLGNIFTKYNYATTDITRALNGIRETIQSVRSDFKITVETSDDLIPLPEDSPFGSWKEARRYAGPLPFTFTCNPQKKEVLIIEGVRQNWTPKPVNVINYRFSFLESSLFSGRRLANAFIIQNIPYYWKKGRTELWKT